MTAGRGPVPPRPALTSSVPPPRPAQAGPPPTPVRLAAVAWAAGALAGLVALVVTARDLDASRARLAAVAAEQDPEATAAVLRSGVATTLLLPVGTVLVALLAGTACLALLLRRRAWSRWVLGVLSGVAGASAVVAADVVRGGPPLDEVGFLACATAMVAVLVAVVLRSVGRWLDVGR